MIEVVVVRKWRDYQGELGVPFEVWLNRWMDQYDDLPTHEHIKLSYPEIPNDYIETILHDMKYIKNIKKIIDGEYMDKYASVDFFDEGNSFDHYYITDKEIIKKIFELCHYGVILNENR